MVTIRSAPAARPKTAFEARGGVAGDRQVPRRGAGGGQHRAEPEAVRGDDLVGAGRLAGHDQLVAGGDQRDHRAAVDRDAGDVHRGEEGDIDRAQPARRGDPGAGREVAAGRADVGLAVAVGAERDAGGVGLDLLLDHHQLGALGHRRAGEDAHRLAGADGAGEARAGGRGADQPEPGAGRGVGGAERVAVHRRGGEGRLRPGGGDVAGEHAAGCVGERHLLDGERCEEAHQPAVGLGDGDQRH